MLMLLAPFSVTPLIKFITLRLLVGLLAMLFLRTKFTSRVDFVSPLIWWDPSCLLFTKIVVILGKKEWLMKSPSGSDYLLEFMLGTF